MRARTRAVLVALALTASSLPASADTRPSDLADCERRVRASATALESYRCFWLIARQNHTAEAAARLGSLLARDPANHRARLYLARIEGDRGGDGAERLFHEALAGFAAARDAEGEVIARVSFALFLGRRGRMTETDGQVAAAARAAAASRDPVLRAWVLNEEGWQAYRKGDYGAGWRLFKEVEGQVFPDGPLPLRASNLSGLGAITWALGRIAESVAYQHRAADLTHEDGDFYDEARARGNLALLAFRLAMDGEIPREEVVAYARDALAAATAGANPGTEARAHLYLGDLTSGLEARAHYERCIALSRQVKELSGVALGLRGLAMNLVEAEPRDPARAYALADEAFALARGSANFFVAALIAVARAHMRWMTGPREQAIADSLAALSAIEAIRDVQDDGLARARVFSGWTFAYERLAGHLLDPESGGPTPADLDAAFAVTERKRARVLLDELDAALATGSAAGALGDERRGVLAKIAQVQRALVNPALPPAARTEMLVTLERLEREEERLRGELARSDPRFGAIRHPTLATLQALQQGVAEDEAVLRFEIASRMNLDNRMTERGSWLWVHTRERVRVYPLPDHDRLKPALALFLGLVERRDGSESSGARRLYDDLLRAAIDELPDGVRRLVVVPDNVLYRLPFHVLRGSDGVPLGARFQISLAPSATLWLHWRSARTHAPDVPALALADPSFTEAAGGAGVARQWSLVTGGRFGRLPYARKEADFLVQRLGGGSTLLVGEQATEQFLKHADLKQFAILHLAAHAAIDDEHPDRSAVLLAPGSDKEDGLLQVREIVGLDLKSRLVVLSACSTASGALLAGEGVMGLARAFFQAGAQAIVASLWPLRDAEAADLFEDFYRAIGEGQSVAAALASAQRARLRAGAPAAAWAGVVVLGDGNLVPLTKSPARPTAWFPIAVVAAVLLLAAAALRTKSRRV